MHDSQFDLRYVVSGITILPLLAVALLVADKFVLLQIATAWGALVALVASGGLGFLFAQLYFLLCFSVPDYRKLAVTLRSQGYVVGLSCRILHPATSTLKRRSRETCKGRRHAQAVVHYVWSAYIANANPELNNLTRTLAARKAAIGASLVGSLLAALLWIWLICEQLLISSMRSWLCLLVFLVPAAVLWRLHQFHVAELERIVCWRLLYVLRHERSKARSASRLSTGSEN